MRYLYRTQERAQHLPSHVALSWVQAHDEGEREVWLEKYRNSPDTLGTIVKHSFAAREAMWEVSPPPPPPRAPQNQQHSSSSGSGRAQMRTAEKHNGKVLCVAWNKGTCQRQNCPLMHRCNKLVGTKACGRNHRSSTCSR